MRDERRLERDDAAPSRSAAAPRPRRGSRHRSRASRSSAPPPRARARRRRRGSRRRARRPRRSCRRRRRRRPDGRRRRRSGRRAPRLTTQRGVELADRVVARARSRRRARARARDARAERVVDERPGRDVERDRAPCCARMHRPPRRPRDAIGSRSERVAGDVEHVAIEPRRLELVAERARVRCRGRMPSSGRRPRRSRRRRRSVRPTGPRCVDAALAPAPRRTSSPAVSAPTRPTKRAVRAERTRPRGDVRRLAARRRCAWSPVWSSPGTSGVSRRTITSSRRSPSVVMRTQYDRRMEGDSRVATRLRSFAIGGLVGAAGVLATARRVSRRTRGRPGSARWSGGVRGCAVLPRARRRGGAALPRRRRHRRRARRTRRSGRS